MKVRELNLTVDLSFDVQDGRLNAGLLDASALASEASGVLLRWAEERLRKFDVSNVSVSGQVTTDASREEEEE